MKEEGQTNRPEQMNVLVSYPIANCSTETQL